jgi:hypothetical protein
MVDLPADPAGGPDQEKYAEHLVFHNRLWLLVIFLGVVIVVLGITLLTVTAKFRPAVSFVTLEGQQAVIWKPDSTLVIGNKSYSPARLTEVIRQFAQARYAYDWTNLRPVVNSLTLMSSDAANVEREKLKAMDLRASVLDRRLTVDLRLDLSAIQPVVSQDGEFTVTIPATAVITFNDGTPGSGVPIERKPTLTLRLRSVPETVNPLGYIVSGTGENRVI